MLLDIKNGEYNYDIIIDVAEDLNEEVKELFAENKANLPEKVDKNRYKIYY